MIKRLSFPHCFTELDFEYGGVKERTADALAGNRTRVNCLEGSYAHHYTTNAVPGGAGRFHYEEYLQNWVGESASGGRASEGAEQKQFTQFVDCTSGSLLRTKRE